MKQIIASAIAYVLKRVLRRRDLTDIVAVFNKVEDDLLAYIERTDAEVDALDAQRDALLEARTAKAASTRTAQRILSSVGALTA